MDYKKADGNKIFKCIAGSHSYGTNTPESDTDYRGIFVSPLHYLVGLDNVEEVHNPTNDDVLYEIRKYIHLASKCNPNILELLFIDDQHILFHNKFYDRIRDSRDLFLSTLCRHTFSGYAHAQLHKIKRHRGYLMNPPDHKPIRAEFNLPYESRVPKDYRAAMLTIPDTYLKEEYGVYIRDELRYENALKDWNSYQDWHKTRNPKRQELEAKFKYDTKHAMHLVRLINMGEEILTKGTLTVFRPEREELKAIRNGAWSYDELLQFSDNIDKRFEDLEKKSTLPFSVNIKAIRTLLLGVLSEFYGVDLQKDCNNDEVPETPHVQSGQKA